MAGRVQVAILGCRIGAWLAGIFCLRISMFGTPEKSFGDGVYL